METSETNAETTGWVAQQLQQIGIDFGPFLWLAVMVFFACVGMLSSRLGGRFGAWARRQRKP